MGRMEGGTLTLRACAQVNVMKLLFIFFHLSSLPAYSNYTPGQSLSTGAAVAITAIVCLITGTLFGALLTVCISRWNKKGHSSKSVPNAQEQQQAVAVYEEVDIQNKKIELEQNVAYGPVKEDQKIELKENVAYGPVKPNQ